MDTKDNNYFLNEINTLPYSLEAEQSVLGSILIDSSCISKILEILKPEYFYIPQHREIYKQMLFLFNMGKPVDFITVLDSLKNKGIYDDSTGKSYLLQLGEIVPSVANVETYAKIVREKYDIRALIETSKQIIDSAVDGQTDASLLIDSAEQKIYEIRQGRKSGSLRKIDDIIAVDIYDRLHKLNSDEKDNYVGIPTGISGVDRITTGLNRSDLVILAARPGMGKTSFALNIAQNVSLHSNKTVCVFSLEMTAEQLVSRMLSSEAMIPGSSLKTGKLDFDEWVRLGKAAEVLSRASLYFDDTAGITIPEIKAKLRRLKHVDLVIIDYLQLMSSGKRTENRVQEVSAMTRSLKMLAKDLDIPVLTLSQLSRTSEQRSSHRPQLSDLRESGSIEQDADIVLFLYHGDDSETKQSLNAPPAVSDTVQCIVAKNRHGAVDSVPLHWQGQYTRFTSQEIVYSE